MSVQTKILAACLCFVAIIAAVGGLAQRQAAEMGRLAIGIYDHAFMGMSYVDQAQADFLRFAAARKDDGDGNDEAVQKVLDRLDVALERAASDRTRETGQETRAVIAGLLKADPPSMAKRMPAADKAMVKLVKKFGADGLDSRDDAEALAARSTKIVLAEIAVAVALALGVGFLVGRSLSRPLRQVVKAIGLLASGDLKSEIPQRLAGRRDEIGEVARAAAVFREAMRANARAEDERARNRDQAEAATIEALRKAADAVERETNAAAEEAMRSSEVLAERASELGALASRMVNSFDAVTEASTTALTSCEVVAAAGEELSASAREIGGQLDRSTTEVGNAARAGERAQTVINQLSASVNQIGSVARLIGEIAAKTNLLALNATIEAARAGEAGRGFAVVAGEVKSLANQTARSTEDIASSVGAIQAVSREVVEAVGEMIERVTAIEGITNTIATAAEQQTSATGEIARNVAGTADAMRVVSNQMDAAAGEARGTDSAVRELQSVAGNVSHQIVELRGVMVRIVRTSSDAAERRNSQRMALGEPARLTVGSRVMKCQCVNISLGGARIGLEEAVPAGAEVVLRLEDAVDLPGKAVGGGTETGIRFNWDPADAPVALRDLISRLDAKCAA